MGLALDEDRSSTQAFVEAFDEALVVRDMAAALGLGATRGMLEELDGMRLPGVAVAMRGAKARHSDGG